MAEEAGLFTFDDIAAAIGEKMLRRHPHVFGGAEISLSAAQSEAREQHKQAERQARARQSGEPDSVLDGVALALPALLPAVKIQARAARVGFDWPDASAVFAKLEEEIIEIRTELDHNLDRQALEDEMGGVFAASKRSLLHARLPALRRSTRFGRK